MTTNYETEEQALATDQITSNEAESETTSSNESENTAASEELYFWSEPGVCG